MNINALIIICFLSVFVSSYTAGQVGVGAGLDFTAPMNERKTDDKNQKPLKNPFVYYFCEHYNADYAEIRNLQLAGYGRKELITLMLIAQDSKTPLAQVANKRKKLTPLKKIAENYKLDYDALRAQALSDKTSIETAIKTKPVTEEEPVLNKSIPLP